MHGHQQPRAVVGSLGSLIASAIFARPTVAVLFSREHAERMTGRIEHDQHHARAGAGVQPRERLTTERARLLQRAVCGAAPFHPWVQALDGYVQVHAHLLLAGDCWPDGGHERFLSLELELVFDVGRHHQGPSACHLLGTIDDFPSQQRRVELGELPSIATADYGSAQSRRDSLHGNPSNSEKRSF